MDTESLNLVGALTIKDFCRLYSIGRSFAYAEIKSGRLAARKAGNRTLILRVDAERWVASLSTLGGRP